MKIPRQVSALQDLLVHWPLASSLFQENGHPWATPLFSTTSSGKLTRDQSDQLPPSEFNSLIPFYLLHLFHTHTYKSLCWEKEEKMICALTYFFFKMYVGPSLLCEFVTVHKQVVDIVGWEAVRAGVYLIKFGQQEWELKGGLKHLRGRAGRYVLKWTPWVKSHVLKNLIIHNFIIEKTL